MKQDWAFERQFVARNSHARVICVDPSVGARLFARQILESTTGLVASRVSGRRRDARKHAAVLRRSVDYFSFFGRRHRHLRLRVAASPGSGAITLAHLLDRARPSRPHSAFVKMDIEGSEYDVVPHILECEQRINCLVAEFHRISERCAAFDAAITALRSRFHIVHVHGNNYGGYASAIEFPDVIEMTFVNRALLPGELVPSRERYPRQGLDRPNKPSQPDFELRFD